MLLFLVFSPLRAIASSFLLTSLSISFLCMSMVTSFFVSHTNMTMAHENKVTTSIESTISNCCGSEGSTHIEIWKNTFLGILPNLLVLLVLFIGVFVPLIFPDFFKKLSSTESKFAIQLRQYIREHPNIALFNPLRLAFARGILHPKRFT